MMRTSRWSGFRTCLIFLLWIAATGMGTSTAPSDRDTSRAASAADSVMDTVVADTTRPDLPARPERLNLDNGLRVIVQALPGAALVRVEMYFDAGAAWDPDSLAGLAHLTEHLLCESSPQHPDGDLARQETLYAVYGNAFTSSFTMCFVTDCLPQFLPEILALEADRMRGAAPAAASFARERNVVLEELAFRSHSSPGQELREEVLCAAYPDHPYGRRVGGSRESIERITREDVARFQIAHFHPANAALAIVGPVEPATVLAAVKDAFAAVPFPPASNPQEMPDLPPSRSAQTIIDRSDHEGCHLMLGFRIPLQEDEDLLMVSILEHFLELAGCRTSVKLLPEEAFVSIDAYTTYWRPPADPNQEYGYIYPDFDPERDSLELMRAVWRRIQRSMKTLQDEEGFGEIRRELLDGLVRHGKQASLLAGDLGGALISGREPVTVDMLHEFLLGLDREDILGFFSRWIVPERAVVGVCHGRDSGRMARVELPERTGSRLAAPVADPLARLTARDIEPVLAAYRTTVLSEESNHRLSNGIPVYCVSWPDAPDLMLGGLRIFPCLKDERAGKKRGLCRLYDMIVDQGYHSPPDDDRGPRVVRMPCDVSLDLQPFRLVYTARGPASKIDELCAQLNKRLESDDFNLSYWRQIVRGGEDFFARRRAGASVRAWCFRWSSLFGEQHPILGLHDADPQTVRKIRYSDIQKLHRKVTETGRTSLVAIGDLDPEVLIPELEATFGRRGEYEEVPGEPAPQPATGRHGKVIPNFEREDVRLEVSLTPRSCGEETPLSGGALAMLDAALQNRLRSRVRAEEGMTYDIQAMGQPGGGCVVPEIATTCHPSQAPAVFAVLIEELEGIAAEGFSADEISRAKLGCMKNLFGTLRDPESRFWHLIWLLSLREDPGRYQDQILDLSAEELNSLAHRYVSAQNLTFTVTGPLFEEDIQLFAP